ncbi:eukaryotic aspartyl protease domain-containing protein [Ditylenchus destructor]|nr:eukaryotic aspartyl protease domain-containing protein [Ditylenchus destructor]
MMNCAAFIIVLLSIFQISYLPLANAKILNIKAKYHRIRHPNATPKFNAVVADGYNQNFTNYRDGILIGNISVGTPAEQFTVFFNLRDGDSWLLSKDLHISDETGEHEKKSYIPSASKTYSPNGPSFYDNYGNGSRASDLYNVIDGIKPVRHYFGILETMSYGSLQFLPSIPVDGVLGLFPQSKTKNNVSSFLHTVSDQLDEKVMTIWIEKTLDYHVVTPQCEITLGGTNPAHCQPSQWFYMPTTDPENWKIRIDSIAVQSRNGTKISNEKRINTVATAHYFTLYMAGPGEQIEWIAQHLGLKSRFRNVFYKISCNKSAAPAIVFGMGSYGNVTLTPDDYILEVYPGTCIMAFLPNAYFKEWYLGSRFFNSHCTAWNFADNTMGFAPSLP